MKDLYSVAIRIKERFYKDDDSYSVFTATVIFNILKSVITTEKSVWISLEKYPEFKKTFEKIHKLSYYDLKYILEKFNIDFDTRLADNLDFIEFEFYRKTIWGIRESFHLESSSVEINPYAYPVDLNHKYLI